MDIWILTGVIACLDERLRGAPLEQLDRGADRPRVRLVFAADGGPRTVVLGFGPGPAWLGRPARAARVRPAIDTVLAGLRRALRGSRLERLERPPGDRSAVFRFADGQSLVAELGGASPSLVLVDGSGRIGAAWRPSGPARGRLRVAGVYAPQPRPAGRLDPLEVRDPAEVDAALAAGLDAGLDPGRAVRKLFLGLSPATARLIAAEARAAGSSLGEVACRRADELRRGERADPVVEGPDSPLEAAERGALREEDLSLLAWPPSWQPGPGTRRQRGADAAATAALYHEALDLALSRRARATALAAIVERELRRLRRAERQAAADAASFGDFERSRRWGEALLAGLASARRAGDGVLVPDPWDPGGAWVRVPVPAGHGLPQAAKAHFERHRRARRGLAIAEARVRELGARRRALERLHDDGAADDPDRLERRMLGAGIPVALEPRRKGSAPRERPRPEGVRLFLTDDGLSALIGKTAKDNHRLTFRLAAPDDFWFHALGVTGAHVVVRNDERQGRPPARTLEQAAAAAAWFSEARGQDAVDVQWTRRKYVRKPRGAAPGTVVVRRFETVRVRPAAPPASEGR